jgi:hypothetical protein
MDVCAGTGKMNDWSGNFIGIVLVTSDKCQHTRPIVSENVTLETFLVAFRTSIPCAKAVLIIIYYIHHRYTN